MYRNRYDSKGSAEIGQYAEDLFQVEACKKKWTVIPATKEQNYKEHWDYLLRKPDLACYVEVKGMKRLNRKISQDDSLVCIEIQGNTGYPGWLYGKSTHIAFLMKEGFVLVTRKKLVELIEKIVDVKIEPIPSVPNKKLHVIYRRVRYKHLDKIVYISKEELLSVEHKLWEIENV